MNSKLTHKEYLMLAIPFIISTITQPLLGAVDTAVVGRLSNSTYIGGVSIGTVIFNTIYWIFGFLRVSTSAYSAQALGSNDDKEGMLAFIRPMCIAMVLGFTFILFQGPIGDFALSILKPSEDIKNLALKYFSILIWGAPLVLGNYVILGWLMGQAKLKESLFMQITTNVVNIVLDLLLVQVFNYNVGGVAVATLISQMIGFGIGCILMINCDNFSFKNLTKEVVFDKEAFKSIMKCNTDLMIRTICLLITTNMFIAKGAELGSDILAANAILFQIQYIMSYIFDGLANASSVFAGKAIGKDDKELFDLNIKRSGQWSMIFVIIITAMYFFGKSSLMRLFTNIEKVLNLIWVFDKYLLWFPLFAAVGLVYYGVFSGATETKPIRDSMILSLIAFLIADKLLISTIGMGNHGLWVAFLIFCLSRSVFLIMYLPYMRKRLNFKSYSNIQNIKLEG